MTITTQAIQAALVKMIDGEQSVYDWAYRRAYDLGREQEDCWDDMARGVCVLLDLGCKINGDVNEELCDIVDWTQFRQNAEQGYSDRRDADWVVDPENVGTAAMAVLDVSQDADIRRLNAIMGGW